MVEQEPKTVDLDILTKIHPKYAQYLTCMKCNHPMLRFFPEILCGETNKDSEVVVYRCMYCGNAVISNAPKRDTED